MTTRQKALVVATVVALGGAGIYEAHKTAELRRQVQTLQQQQAPMMGQIDQLKSDGEKLKRQIVALTDENARLSGNSEELLKLRGEVGVLRTKAQDPARATTADTSLETAAREWVNRTRQLKDYVGQHPEEHIPELQFLSERQWLVISGDTGLDTVDFRTADDFRRGVELLRLEAETRFSYRIQEALRKYASANNGEFPRDVSQLQPYCDSAVGELLVQSYEIIPSTVLSASLVQENNIKTDWVVTRKKRVNANSTSRLAIFADGFACWQSPP